MTSTGKSISELQLELGQGQYSLSRHALRRLVERNIPAASIREAGANAELIEDYPDDKFSPSCLLLGFTRTGQPLHLQVSRSPNPMVRIITLYYPSLEDWDDFRVRRSRP
ncbi:MAG: DUF4258 domain-containing protein [Candidatus Riflebacteria bacterium]|nr:DUF4258 domain-containing protein [Candidatus Riflebacteria bacterium]